jgi:hypothetical protein
MKLTTLLLGSLALTASANAQYFSGGWAPGKAVPTKVAASSSSYAPEATSTKTSPGISSLKDLSSMFDLSNLLASGPVASLAARAGINISEKLAEVKSRTLWDDRIPLITDDNYEDIIVNEPMTEKEEKDRVWFLVITVTSTGQESVSKYVDQVFDSAYNLTQAAGDLTNVRWGRIDYLNVTAITTKWAVWSAPYIVVVTDRGRSLRFYKASQIRLNDEIVRQFLKEEGWKSIQPWDTAYSPGGDREWVMEYLAIFMTTTYNSMMILPKWVLYLITGALGSVIIGLLHKNPQQPAQVQPKPAPKPVINEPVPTLPAPTASSKTTKRGGTKSKKTVKK